MIRAQRGVSAEALIDLGLRGAGGLAVGADTDEVRAEERPPWVSVSAPGRRVTVRLRRAATERARPERAVGVVYWWAGDVPPASVSGWQLAGNTTQGEMSFVLPLSVEPGTKLWVCAAWLDRKLKPGQLSNPKETRVGFGFVMAA